MKSDKQLISFGRGIIKEEISALNKLQKSINSSFSKAINAINKNKGFVIFCGVGKSKLILDKTCGTFQSLGISSYVLDPSQASHGSLGNIRSDDLFIIASNSGETNELLPILKLARENKNVVIGITSGTKSKLAKHSNIKIFYPNVKEAGDANFKSVPTSSTTVLNSLGDALAITIAKSRGFTISKFAKAHPGGSIGKSLASVSEIMMTGRQIPYVNANLKFPKILNKIASAKLGCVIVKMKNSSKLGFLTDGDCARAAKKFKNLQEVTAKQFMTKNPKYIDENLKIPQALKLMNKSRINILLVKSKGKFKGICSLHSVLEFLQK